MVIHYLASTRTAHRLAHEGLYLWAKKSGGSSVVADNSRIDDDEVLEFITNRSGPVTFKTHYLEEIHHHQPHAVTGPARLRVVTISEVVEAKP